MAEPKALPAVADILRDLDLIPRMTSPTAQAAEFRTLELETRLIAVTYLGRIADALEGYVVEGDTVEPGADDETDNDDGKDGPPNPLLAGLDQYTDEEREAYAAAVGSKLDAALDDDDDDDFVTPAPAPVDAFTALKAKKGKA